MTERVDGGQSAEKPGTTRRDFLRGSLALGAGAALTSAVGFATGCSGGGGSTNGSSSDSGSGRYPYTVHETDVLVVGGGLSGITAARRAASFGARVTVVDKGKKGHSGASGMNWGHDTQSLEWMSGDGTGMLPVWITQLRGVSDQAYSEELCKAMKQARSDATFEQCGNVLERTEDGGQTVAKNRDGLAVNHGSMVRYLVHDALRKGIRIDDYTQALSILVSEDGQAAGVVALDVKDGSAHVYRSKTVIMATGSYAFIAGWNGISAYSLTGRENTGDGAHMLINAGLDMIDMEQLPVDLAQWTPLGTRQGLQMGASGVNHTILLDRNYNRFTQIIEETPGYSTVELIKLCAKGVLDGIATDNNGFYADTTNLEHDNRYYRRSRENEIRAMGYEMPQYVELVPDQWETAAHPVGLTGSSETSIPGLYFAGAGEGAWRGMCFFSCYGSGWMSGKGSAEKALSMSSTPQPKEGDINATLEWVYGLLENEPSEKIRSTDIFRSIQNTYFNGLFYIRNEEGMTKTLEELRRIKAEDFPKMYVPSKSRQFNSDWQQAIEAHSLMTCAMGTGYSALERKETRGGHCRTDYPKMDNDNWIVHVAAAYKDGEWTTSIVPIDDSIYSADEVREMLPPALGIE